MAVKKGDKIAVHYKGWLNENELFDSSYESGEPIKFEVGAKMVIDGFDEAVLGMEIGDKKRVVIPPEKAYGEYDDNFVFSFGRGEFPEGAEIKVGSMFNMQSAEGDVIPVVVKQIEGDTITLDANHQLAGKTLTFDLELVGTGVEIPEYHHHCGCGCEDEGCDCGDECDCDGDCDCEEEHDNGGHGCGCGCGHHH